MSWSIDFTDGTSANGSWGTAPPVVAHEFGRDVFGNLNCHGVVGPINGVCLVTLTVTDSAGQSDSEAMAILFIDQSPG